MGIPSGGSFGGSSGGSSSAFSSGGRFDDSSSSFHHHHHHHHQDYRDDSFNDPVYYNNQSRGGSRGGGRGEGCRNPCTIFASVFAFWGSFWVIFGMFKSEQPLMSLNYSRLISANSVFVKEIQIQNLRDPGPVVYSFSKTPALREYVNYNETHDDIVESNSHREWRFWLNKGSTIEFSYDVRRVSRDYLVLAFIRGMDGLEDWTKAPESSAKALKWYRIHDRGVKDFAADKDGDYFIAYGNLNNRDFQVTSKLNIHSTLYSVKGADKWTALTSDVNAVNVPLPFFHSNSILLTTPSKPLDGADVWEVAVVYSTRWITYISIWGAIVAVILVIFGLEVGGRMWPRSREELPLLAPQDDQAVRSHATSNSSSVAISTPSGEFDERGGSPRDDHQLCTICLDAPKDCFFDPCGHRCTCYGCGQRIQESNSGLCPICRQPIRAVRKIFDS